MPTNAVPKPRPVHRNAFSIPVPKARTFGPMSPRGGPVTSAPTEDYSPSESPSPMMSSGSSGSRGHRSRGYSFSNSGNAGNPGPGNPNGAPGVDSLRQADWGPYMSELQRKIKRNWTPPRGNESKRVMLLFKISRDGRIISLRVKQSSGNSEADNAAKAAVELSAPFKPLPPEYRGGSVDIDFTFDYNVMGISGRRSY
jgi:TonB family protein